MASSPDGTDEASLTSALQEFVTAFPTSSFELLAPINGAMGRTKVDAAAAKRLERARMLHTVISSKLPKVKVEDLQKMCVEWVHGLLEATFPLETSLVDGDCSDRATLDCLLDVLDGAHAIAAQLAALQAESTEATQPKKGKASDANASSKVSGGAAGSSSSDGDAAPSREEVTSLLQSAVEAGAQFKDVVPGSAPEARALGYEVWEALCWRRGALRYYMASTYVNARLAELGKATQLTAAESSKGLNTSAASLDDASAEEGSASGVAPPSAGGADDATAVTIRRAGVAAVPHAALIAASHSALSLLLSARRDRSDIEHVNMTEAKLAAALRYGVYSTTHLLALAFDTELCYWRWAAGRDVETPAKDAEPGAVAGIVDVSEPTPPADAPSSAPATAETDDEGVWYRRACVDAHRYLHTVTILMEGCGWDTTRTHELLKLLSAGRAEAVANALRGEEGVAEREMAMLKLGSGNGEHDGKGGDRNSGVAPANDAPRKKGGKKGKARS